MRIATRVKKLEGAVPRCDPRMLRLACPDHVPSEGDQCRRCGGCHVLVVEEQIVESGPDGPVPASSREGVP